MVVLDQLLAALLQHRPAQLQRLELVQLALVEQDAEVLEQGRRDARLGRDLLELGDGLRSSQDALWRVGCNLEMKEVEGKVYGSRDGVIFRAYLIMKGCPASTFQARDSHT